MNSRSTRSSPKIDPERVHHTAQPGPKSSEGRTVWLAWPAGLGRKSTAVSYFAARQHFQTIACRGVGAHKQLYHHQTRSHDNSKHTSMRAADALILPSSCLDGSITPVGPGQHPRYPSASTEECRGWLTTRDNCATEPTELQQKASRIQFYISAEKCQPQAPYQEKFGSESEFRSSWHLPSIVIFLHELPIHTVKWFSHLEGVLLDRNTLVLGPEMRRRGMGPSLTNQTADGIIQQMR